MSSNKLFKLFLPLITIVLLLSCLIKKRYTLCYYWWCSYATTHNHKKMLSLLLSVAFAAAFLYFLFSQLLKKPFPLPSNDEQYWQQIRDMYPLTKERVYFNTGGLGSAPTEVLEKYYIYLLYNFVRVHNLTMSLASMGEHGHDYIEQARAPVAQWFNVQKEEICFTRNATESNSIVASGLTLQQGDEVIIDSHAHPGVCCCYLLIQHVGIYDLACVVQGKKNCTQDI